MKQILSENMATPRPVRERLLIWFFAALFFVNLGFLLVGFASLPLYYERVTTLTIEPYLIGTQDFMSSALVRSGAAMRGLTLPQYVIEQIVFDIVFSLPILVIATVIMWRARRNWFAWYSAFIVIFIGEYVFNNPVYVARLMPLPLYEANSICWPLVLLYFFFFPNGKPAPRRAVWLVVPLSLFHLATQILGLLTEITPLPPVLHEEFISTLFNALLGLEAFLILGSQVYRYWRVSSPLEKQQTKWFLLGLAMFAFSFFLPQDGWAFSQELELLLFAFLPLGIGVAMLRYRLWDIDILIRRTLIYGILTALLTLIYVGLILALQSLAHVLTGQEQDHPVFIVGSTLASAALFLPLRRRVQRVIDRRFYRSRYNASKTVDEFGTTLRQEVELGQLSERLLAVVQETMQPAHISLWLLPPSQEIEEQVARSGSLVVSGVDEYD
ncbi:MAG TPA: hypothetical protein VGD98_07655 [Ktedonobacteraceae bacterium]